MDSTLIPPPATSYIWVEDYHQGAHLIFQLKTFWSSKEVILAYVYSIRSFKNTICLYKQFFITSNKGFKNEESGEITKLLMTNIYTFAQDKL